MARLWCAIKPGSQMIIGVPTGPDKLYVSPKEFHELI